MEHIDDKLVEYKLGELTKAIVKLETKWDIGLERLEKTTDRFGERIGAVEGEVKANTRDIGRLWSLIPMTIAGTGVFVGIITFVVNIIKGG